MFSYKSVNLLYTDLDPKLSYVLALTYSSDHVYNRVQSLWADGVELHEPYALPKAKASRVVVQVPERVTRGRRLALQLRIHGEVNATVSIAELWGTAPPKQDVLRVAAVSGLVGDLTGRVLDTAYEPAALSFSAPHKRVILRGFPSPLRLLRCEGYPGLRSGIAAC